jgi:hypothetical protein
LSVEETLLHAPEEVPIRCPYCGEEVTVVVDGSIDRQSYTEDCEVCCQPMLLDIVVDDDGIVTVVPGRET